MRSDRVALFTLLVSVLVATPVKGDALTLATPAAADSLKAGQTRRSLHPQLSWQRDAPHVAQSFTTIAISMFLNVNIRPVPPQGLDPTEIRLSLDRDQVGKLSTRAADVSDVTSAAAVTYPMAIAFMSQGQEERFSGTLRRSVVYLESFLLATGTCQLIKNGTDRPRPYTYVPVDQRQDAIYDVTKKEAFQSLPSSHASSSFCGAAFAMTDHLFTRPHAAWPERVGVAFTGGFLAGMTSVLRVSAGKHFPTDVITGGAVGMASGITVPLAHRYVTPGGSRGPSPSASAWMQAFGGLLAGVGGGILAAQAFD